jgi:hypothetical protein
MILKDIGQKPGELVRDFAIRFNKGYRTIQSMMNLRAINVPANEAERTIAVCQKLYADGYRDAQDDMRKILFVSTLEMPLLTKVVQKPIPTFVDAMEHASQLQMLAQKQSTIGQINQIQEQSKMTSDAEFVNQITQGYHNGRGNNRGNSRGRGNRGQSRGNGNRGRGHFSGGYYSNKNNGNGNGGNNQNKEAPKLNTKIKCLFCDIPGHHQDDCRKRIEAGKPCRATSGKEYFPKSKMYPVTEEEMDADMGQSSEHQSAIREAKSEYLFQ